MVRVKICGITNLKDAQAALDCGCDALGFVFYKKSQRYISPGKAKEIITQLPRKIRKVGVFVNAPVNRVKKIAKLCRLDMLQFHGNETPQYCRRFKGSKTIKAFRIKDKIKIKDILAYNTFAYLFDTFKRGRFGGTGRRFNWKLLKDLGKIKQCIFLSGGLNSTNVSEAIAQAKPEWIDVSSALESRPGKKDHNKIKKFIKITKG